MSQRRKIQITISTLSVAISFYYYLNREKSTFSKFRIIQKEKKDGFLSFKISQQPKIHVPYYYAVKHPNIQALRHYSPILDEGLLKFIIRLYPVGLMGEYLSTADQIEMKGPYSHPALNNIDFEKVINDKSPILCIAAGTGVLPFYQILRKYPNANIKLLYCTNDDLLKSELSVYSVKYYSSNERLTEESIEIDQDYKYVIVCGSDKFTNALCGYDNDEQYSMKSMYNFENGIPFEVKSKELSGWLCKLKFKKEQVFVL